MRSCSRQVFLTLVVAVIAITPTVTFSADVMFILGNEGALTAGDEAQLAIFEERGDTVDIWGGDMVRDDAFLAFDVADDSDLVYIDESVSSSRADALIDTTTPVINNEQFAYDNWFMTDAPTDHGSPDTPGIWGGSHIGVEIQIVDDQHPIALAAGMSNGNVEVYSDDGAIIWGFPAPDADIVAIIPGFDGFDPAGAIFVYEQGDELINGDPAPGMRIGNFLSDIDGGGMGKEATLLTDAGKALMNAVIDYALGIITTGGGPQLQAGDADQDLDFDQFDLIKVQIAATYLSGTAATWGDGDWNGAPGGSQGNPPAGDVVPIGIPVRT